MTRAVFVSFLQCPRSLSVASLFLAILISSPGVMWPVSMFSTLHLETFDWVFGELPSLQTSEEPGALVSFHQGRPEANWTNSSQLGPAPEAGPALMSSNVAAA